MIPKTWFRFLIKHKFTFVLNIAGLTASLLAFFLIYQYVLFEKSYDRFNTKAERTYRAAIQVVKDSVISYSDAMNFEPAGQAMLDDFEEVVRYSRITPENANVVLRYGDKFFNESRIYYSDSTFFDMFDFEFIQGTPSQALNKAGSIVLTKSVAEKYFGPYNQWSDSKIGELIQFNSTTPLAVTGIIEDIPINTHLEFKALISIENFPDKYRHPTKEWGFNNFYTYIELREKLDCKALEAKLPSMLEKHFDPSHGLRIVLQPLIDIHLFSDFDYEIEANGNNNSVQFLLLIALIIVIIGWANYINLVTAKASDRIMEVGIKKINGAGRIDLMLEFLRESFIINVAAFIIAMIGAYLITPSLSEWLGISMNFAEFIGDHVLEIIGVCFISSLITGFYPAFILASVEPKQIIHTSPGKAMHSNSPLRKVLVVFQFVITAILIVGTVVVYNQLSFMQKQNLGFDIEKIIVLKSPGTIANDTIFNTRFESFKALIKSSPRIKNVGLSSAIPGQATTDLDYYGGIRIWGEPAEKSSVYPTFKVDDAFSDVYNLEVIAGETFREGMVSHDNSVLINEAAAFKLGFANAEAAIGKSIRFMGEQKPILGVVQDYHHKSLKTRVEPIIMYNKIDQMDYYSIQHTINSSADYKELISDLTEAWNQIYPNAPFEYFFLEDHFNEQYKSDVQFSTLFLFFTIVAIIIACLGLVGLASYSVSRRLREVGIRKVLGATPMDILYMLSKYYIALLIIAFAISIPISWYMLESWLADFPYRISLSWPFFVVSIVIVSLASLSVVFLQSMRALNLNPTIVLRQN